MENTFLGLSLIIVIATAVALLMRVIGQPLIIGHIITGIIVGPAVLHAADSLETLDLFAEIGISLLLFIVGLGLNPKTIKEVGKTASLVGGLQIFALTLVGFVAGQIFGLSAGASILLGASLSFSSTIIALKLIGDKKEQGRLYGKMSIGILLAQDLVAVALLVIVSAGENNSLNLASLVGLILKLGLISWAIYTVSTKLLPKFHNIIAGNQEFLFLFAISWGLGSAALFSKIGLSTKIGALLAGVCLAGLPSAQEISSKLRPLRDFFLIVFFISLGSTIILSDVTEHTGLIISGILAAVVIKPIITMGILGFMGYTKRTSFNVGIALAQVSEFSIVLILLASSKELIPGYLVSSVVFIALASIAASTYMILFTDKLFNYFEKYLNLFEKRKGIAEPKIEADYELVLFGYQRGGHEFIDLFKKLGKKYVAIDYDPEIIDILISKKINYLYGDATDGDLLEEAGLDHAKLVVSTIPDFEVNQYLLGWLANKNPRAVAIMHTDDPLEAAKLYNAGASYVILPHYIGSEQVSTFISKSGLSKEAFKKQRKKHLDYLEKHYGVLGKLSAVNQKKFGHAIVAGMTALTKSKT